MVIIEGKQIYFRVEKQSVMSIPSWHASVGACFIIRKYRSTCGEKQYFRRYSGTFSGVVIMTSSFSRNSVLLLPGTRDSLNFT